MPVPFYGDLGGKARGVLNSGYAHGLMKLKVDLKTQRCICFNATGQSKQEDGNLSGTLSTNYKCEKHGICLTEKWNTSNELTTELELSKLYPGLSVKSDVTFIVHEGFKNAHLGANYSNKYLAFNSEVSTEPAIGAALVLGTNWNWYPGVQIEYNVNDEKLTKANVSLDYIADDFSLHTNVDNGTKFGGLIYQRCTEKIEAGLGANFNNEDNETELFAGAKYTIDKDASVCCKIDNSYKVSLGYKQQLREGISMNLCALLDGKMGDKPGHKLGLSVEFQG